jgi:hypothetical protein
MSPVLDIERSGGDRVGRLLIRHERHHRALRQREERRERAHREAFRAESRRPMTMTEEIRSEPGEAERLNLARRHAREGKLMPLAEFRRELAAEDE